MSTRHKALLNVLAAGAWFAAMWFIPVPGDAGLLEAVPILVGLPGAAFFLRRARRLAELLPDAKQPARGQPAEASYWRVFARSWLLPALALAAFVYVASQV